jgi:hypothetical protein
MARHHAAGRREGQGCRRAGVVVVARRSVGRFVVVEECPPRGVAADVQAVV